MFPQDTSREPAIVMAYSHDGFGLGHLRRNATIQARLVPDVPESDVLDYPVCDEALELDGAAKAADRLSESLGKRLYGSAA